MMRAPIRPGGSRTIPRVLVTTFRAPIWVSVRDRSGNQRVSRLFVPNRQESCRRLSDQRGLFVNGVLSHKVARVVQFAAISLGCSDRYRSLTLWLWTRILRGRT